MLIFPQLASGAVAQYPFVKNRTERTVINRSEDGYFWGFADPYSAHVRWELYYEELTRVEAQTLATFFETCEGSLQSFTFLDPSANLLVFSEDQAQPAFQRNSLLQLTPGVADPFGGSHAFTLLNTSGAFLELTQTVQIPGSVTCNFSFYARSAAPVDLSVKRNDGSTVFSKPIRTTNVWQRFSVSSTFASSTSAFCDFSLSVQPSDALQIFGFQLDAQPSPNTYLPSTSRSGVYPESRFASDELTMVATGPGLFRAKVSVVSRAQF